MFAAAVIPGAKRAIARHWPVLRLRTIIFGTLLFVAALPGFGALFLRVYENALVRRTEAELVAQGAALASSAAILWPGRPMPSPASPSPYGDMMTEVDLRSSAILPERPAPRRATRPPDPQAVAVADRLATAIAETRQATLASILILDRQAIIVGGPQAGGSLADLLEVRRALSGHAATVLRRNDAYRPEYAFEWLSRASNLRLHHARPIRVGGRVVGVILVSRSPRALFRGIYEDRGKIALGVAIIFALLILLSGILSRAIVRPVEALSRATRALAEGRGQPPQRPSLEVVEIRDLYDDFGVMADSIDRRSRYLRDFAASVSHEFKTPLAGIRGAIELLQDHGVTMSKAEREGFLANMASDADRLSRLVRRLMELAQADMRLPQPAAATPLLAVLARVADSFRTLGFTLDLALPDTLSAALIDAAGLEAIATTLLENARQAGARRITIAADQDGAMLHVDVIDDGPGVDPRDADRIFDPFFTSKRAEGGTGLGLAIARSLAQAHRGSLTLQAARSGGHFRLTLLAQADGQSGAGHPQ